MSLAFNEKPIETLEEGENSTFKEFIDFFRDLLIILLVVVFIRTFIVTPFRINGQSMEESYFNNEYILVDKFSYLDLPKLFGNMRTSAGDGTIKEGWTWLVNHTIGKIPLVTGEPRRGDVIVLTPHVDINREYYIKRVIGVPGDIIKFSSGNVFIKKRGASDFVKLNEPYLSANNRGQTALPINISPDSQFTVPEDMYWVMGDNRINSTDSRHCFRSCDKADDIYAHFIKREDVLGKVWLDFGYFNIFEQGGLLRDGKMSWTQPPRLLSHPRSASYPEFEFPDTQTGALQK